MGRLTEGSAKLAAEMRGRQSCGTSEVGHIDFLAVVSIGKVSGACEVAARRNFGHASSLPDRWRGSATDASLGAPSDDLGDRRVRGLRRGVEPQVNRASA